MSAIRKIAKTILSACVSREKFLVSGPRSTVNRPALALTFDDGPHPEHTPRLLDRLDSLGLRATFFVIGREVEKYPQLIQRMQSAGHEVANHTYTHSEPKITKVKTFLDEVAHTDGLLSSLTGQIPSVVRPPKGELNWTKLRGLWYQQKTVALWNVDPKDFRMKTSAEMSRWCDTYNPKDGDILLLHDIHPYAIQAVEFMAARRDFERFETTTISNWIRPAHH